MPTRRQPTLLPCEQHPCATRPSEVSADTPLESLNLNWRERDLPERERTKHVHRLHPYLGKFIPQLVEVFLRKYFNPGDVIADPFCGSGTALVQANELGIHSIGADISAFNVLLARAKTAPYNLSQLKKEVSDVLYRTNASLARAGTLPGFDSASVPVEPPTDYLRTWYARPALAQLLTFREIALSGVYEYVDLLKVILSRAARSARLTTHYDLDFPKQPVTTPYYCHKHSRVCQPTTDAMKFLNRYSLDTVRRIAEFQRVRTEASCLVYHADSRKLALPDIAGAITSPPYVGLIDYHEQHRYAYELLGLDDRRAQEIGPAANGSAAQARLRYQSEIAEVFRRCLCAMPAGGRLIVVASDKYGLYNGIAENIGVVIEATVHRHVNRRTGRRNSEFFESVFVWRKP